MQDLTQKFVQSAQVYQKQNHLQRLKKYQGLTVENVFNDYTFDIHTNLANVNKIMDLNKERYFTNSSFIKGAFSEEEREEFDLEILKLIKQCQKNIDKIEELFNKENEDDRQFMQYKNSSQYSHKKLTISCLNTTLNQVSQKLKKFKQHRTIKQEKILQLTQNKMKNQSEKRQSIVQKRLEQQKSFGSQKSNSVLNEQDEDKDNKSLELEQSRLLYSFKDDSEQIKESQKKLLEISGMITQCSEKLAEQDILTDQILSDAKDSMYNVNKGNQQLMDAKRYNESVGGRWSFFFFLLAFILLILDYLKS